MWTLTLGSFFTVFLAVIFVLLCFLLCLVILIQKPKGGGLSGAFGGAGGGSQSVFGGKAGDALTWITVGFFVAFLLIGMLLVAMVRVDAEGEGVQTRPVQVESQDGPGDGGGQPGGTTDGTTPGEDRGTPGGQTGGTTDGASGGGADQEPTKLPDPIIPTDVPDPGTGGENSTGDETGDGGE